MKFLYVSKFRGKPNPMKLVTGDSIVSVEQKILRFLGAENYGYFISTLSAYQCIRYRMFLKMHFLLSRLTFLNGSVYHKHGGVVQEDYISDENRISKTLQLKMVPWLRLMVIHTQSIIIHFFFPLLFSLSCIFSPNNSSYTETKRGIQITKVLDCSLEACSNTSGNIILTFGLIQFGKVRIFQQHLNAQEQRSWFID